jgi:DNA-binding MarR family transcriptional regulator
VATDPSADPGGQDRRGGRHDAALSFPFGIGTKAANRPNLFQCAVCLISQPRFLHFTVNHYTLIHEASRLVIVSVLNECESADFNFLLGTTGLTRGNLSTHMAKLVAAGYVEETKQFVNRKQLTQYKLSPAGRDAYKKYRADWINLTNGSGRRGEVTPAQSPGPSPANSPPSMRFKGSGN